jgi:pimeloyl-ACP methyl ester carboxylesterase
MTGSLFPGMTTLEELRAMGVAALALPSVVRRRGCGSVHALDEGNSRYPVLLVHGYAGTEAVWSPLRDALSAAGFGHQVTVNYNSFSTDPVEVAAELAQQAHRALADSGAEKVHLVGHSLGGLIVRHAVMSAIPPFATATAITIASPHRGAPLARIAPGKCRGIMTSNRTPANDLAARRVRWLAYYSDGDRVVPAGSARLDDTRLSATNVLIPGCGHLTICRDPRLIRSLVGELIRSERPTPEAAAAVASLAA